MTARTSRARFLARLATSGPFGLGASSLGNLYEEMDDAQAADVVDAAWNGGVRLFDTAPFYGFGLSERRLGDALRRHSREEAIISTKVGRLLIADPLGDEDHGFCAALPFKPVFDYSHDGVMRSFGASLRRLGLDRVDILLMHDIGHMTHGNNHARHWHDAVSSGFRAMEHLREKGLVSAIGLGVNETSACIESLEHANFDLFLVAGRYTLLDNSAETLFERCGRDGIGILAAGGGGGANAPFDYGRAPPAVVTRVAGIERVCERFGLKLPAAAHAFVRRHPAVTQTLLGLRDTSQVASAIDNAQQAIPLRFWGALRDAGWLADRSQT